MLYNDSGTHLLLSSLDFKRATEDQEGYKHIIGRSDLTDIDKDLFSEGYVRYGADCLFPSDIVIGPHCRIGSLCRFKENTVFGDGCEIAAGCTFMPNTIFGDGCSIEGYTLVGPSPLLMVQFPKVLVPVYFANTTEGIIFCNRTLVEPLSEVRGPDLTMLFEGNAERAKHVSKLLIELAKEAYEQAKTDESGEDKKGGGGQEG